jgi:hypothetical protein
MNSLPSLLIPCELENDLKELIILLSDLDVIQEGKYKVLNVGDNFLDFLNEEEYTDD